ncbi:hypothetical protein [Actinophytocola sp.]|uniref:hypothetical protein n=1 Tax=Actinophytocola sp. TaxID=1872138 RepID=UPI003D6B5ADA
MHSVRLNPVAEVVIGTACRVSHRSPALSVLTVPSEHAPHVLHDLVAALGGDGVRYYLSGGAGRFTRPVWGFGANAAVRDVRTAPPTDLTITLGVLHAREAREAAADEELQRIRSWFDRAEGEPRVLLLETLGTPAKDDIAFWQACRLRHARHATQSIVVLRHEQAQAGIGPVEPQLAELLMALSLAGDHVRGTELARWQALRGWDPTLVDAATSIRRLGADLVYTHARVEQHRHAERLVGTEDPGLVSELAAMVLSGQAVPSLPVAALIEDPAAALAAFSPHACAAEVNRRGMSRYAGNLYRRGRAGGWARIARPVGTAAYLAAMVADHRRTTAHASVLLDQAERHGVGLEARAVLAYGIGQYLVKDKDPALRSAGVRMFDRVRDWRTTAQDSDRESGGSQVAASFNGAALAFYRDGDVEVAAEVMKAGLQALHEPGVLDRGHLYDQHVLLLTNLAKVRRRDPWTRSQALTDLREAWRVALDADLLASALYVAADLVRALVETGERAEAEEIARELLLRYDRARETARASERAVVAACWYLADHDLDAGEVRSAATWYLEAARRMRRGGPEVIDAIIRNLRGQQKPPQDVLVELDHELVAKRALADDLVALRACMPDERRAVS